MKSVFRLTFDKLGAGYYTLQNTINSCHKAASSNYVHVINHNLHFKGPRIRSDLFELFNMMKSQSLDFKNSNGIIVKTMLIPWPIRNVVLLKPNSIPAFRK